MQVSLGTRPLMLSDRPAAELPTGIVLPEGAELVVSRAAISAADTFANLANAEHMRRLGTHASTTVLAPTSTPENPKLPAVNPALEESESHLNTIMTTICNGMTHDQRISWRLDDGTRKGGITSRTGEPNLRTSYMTPEYCDVLVTLLQGIPTEKVNHGEGKYFLRIKQSALLAAGGVEAIAGGIRHITSITLDDYAGARSDRPDIRKALTVLNDPLPRILETTGKGAQRTRWIYDRGLRDADNPSLRLDGLTNFAQAGAIVDILNTCRVTAVAGRRTDGGPVVLIQGWRNMAQLLQYPDGVAQDIGRHVASTNVAKPPGLILRMFRRTPATT